SCPPASRPCPLSLHDALPISGPPAWLDTSTAFIGREDELADLVAAVSANQVTVVTGPGGVGKSRLAAESLPALYDRLALPITVRSEEHTSELQSRENLVCRLL